MQWDTFSTSVRARVGVMGLGFRAVRGLPVDKPFLLAQGSFFDFRDPIVTLVLGFGFEVTLFRTVPLVQLQTRLPWGEEREGGRGGREVKRKARRDED